MLKAITLNRISLVIFVLAILAVGWTLGYVNKPGAWYAQLVKPSFNPPNWVFAPVWSLLYVMIAVAGWRTWTRDRGSLAMAAWWSQMAFNFAWSPTFFTLHQPWLAFAVILALLSSIILFIAVQASRDKIAAALFVPYLAWVSFATLLNLRIAQLN